MHLSTRSSSGGSELEELLKELIVAVRDNTGAIESLEDELKELRDIIEASALGQ